MADFILSQPVTCWTPTPLVHAPSANILLVQITQKLSTSRRSITHGEIITALFYITSYIMVFTMMKLRSKETKSARSE
ncbi:hypothetical protein N7486_001230 [Penicillium sp. IBT 16267x]|nr:hypothetical protein N7486_001230 [Penicillium sp. IBT 16267x]